jgi:predicted dehydrogenase
MPDHHILIIGCGSIGERHLRCFQTTQRTQVAGCDANVELSARIAKTYGVPIEGDWEQAVRSGRYTAVVICTPAPLHVRMARTALEAGLDVLVEKPLSHSLTGVADLIATRDRSGRRIVVAYVFHQNPVLNGAGDFVARGEFGPVRHATLVSGQSFHRLRPGYAQTYYRDRAMGGGAIQDALTHSANWMESVLGPTESVMCDCAHLVVPNVTVEDTVHVAARHANALASYSLNQFQAPNETAFQFDAEGGSVRVELNRRRWGHFAVGASDWTWHDGPPAERDTPFIAQANAFLNYLEGKPARTCSLEAGAHTLRFNLAALASAERGCRVRCADIT